MKVTTHEPVAREGLNSNLRDYCDFLALTIEPLPRDVYPSLLLMLTNYTATKRLNAMKALNRGDRSLLPDGGSFDAHQEKSPALNRRYLKDFAAKTNTLNEPKILSTKTRSPQITQKAHDAITSLSADFDRLILPLLDRVNESRDSSRDSSNRGNDSRSSSRDSSNRGNDSRRNSPPRRRTSRSQLPDTMSEGLHVMGKSLQKGIDALNPKTTNTETLQTWVRSVIRALALLSPPNLSNFMGILDLKVLYLYPRINEPNVREGILELGFRLFSESPFGTSLINILRAAITVIEDTPTETEAIKERCRKVRSKLIRTQPEDCVNKLRRTENKLYQLSLVDPTWTENPHAPVSRTITRILNLSPRATPQNRNNIAEIDAILARVTALQDNDPAKIIRNTPYVALTSILRGVLSGYSDLLCGEIMIQKGPVVVKSRVFSSRIIGSALNVIRGCYITMRKRLLDNPHASPSMKLAQLSPLSQDLSAGSQAEGELKLSVFSLLKLSSILGNHIYYHRYASQMPQLQHALEGSPISGGPKYRIIPFASLTAAPSPAWILPKEHTILDAMMDLTCLGPTLAYTFRDADWCKKMKLTDSLIDTAENLLQTHFSQGAAE